MLARIKEVSTRIIFKSDAAVLSSGFTKLVLLSAVFRP